MRLESDPATRVNLRLIVAGRSVVCIHDSWLSEDGELLTSIIEEEAQSVFGFTPQVHDPQEEKQPAAAVSHGLEGGRGTATAITTAVGARGAVVLSYRTSCVAGSWATQEVGHRAASTGVWCTRRITLTQEPR